MEHQLLPGSQLAAVLFGRSFPQVPRVPYPSPGGRWCIRPSHRPGVCASRIAQFPSRSDTTIRPRIAPPSLHIEISTVVVPSLACPRVVSDRPFVAPSLPFFLLLYLVPSRRVLSTRPRIDNVFWFWHIHTLFDLDARLVFSDYREASLSSPRAWFVDLFISHCFSLSSPQLRHRNSLIAPIDHAENRPSPPSHHNRRVSEAHLPPPGGLSLRPCDASKIPSRARSSSIDLPVRINGRWIGLRRRLTNASSRH